MTKSLWKKIVLGKDGKIHKESGKDVKKRGIIQEGLFTLHHSLAVGRAVKCLYARTRLK